MRSIEDKKINWVKRNSGYLILVAIIIALLFRTAQYDFGYAEDRLRKLDSIKLVLDRKNDSLIEVLKTFPLERERIDGLIDLYKDSLRNAKIKSNNIENAIRDIPSVVSGKSLLDSIAEHIVF